MPTFWTDISPAVDPLPLKVIVQLKASSTEFSLLQETKRRARDSKMRKRETALFMFSFSYREKTAPRRNLTAKSAEEPWKPCSRSRPAVALILSVNL